LITFFVGARAPISFAGARAPVSFGGAGVGSFGGFVGLFFGGRARAPVSLITGFFGGAMSIFQTVMVYMSTLGPGALKRPLTAYIYIFCDFLIFSGKFLIFVTKNH
jgi:hypothetical protein